MAIFGPGPLDSDSAIEEYGAVMYIICDRIDGSIAALDSSKNPEQVVMALVAALRFLCAASPGAANLFLERGRLLQWRERYLSWLDEMDSQLPLDFKEGMRASVREEFDILLSFGGVTFDF